MTMSPGTHRLRRLVLLVLPLVAAGLLGVVAVAAPTAGASDDPLPGVAGRPFDRGGSWIYHYVSQPEPFCFDGFCWDYPATPFDSITDDIENGYYTDRGVTSLAMYGPYHSTGAFRGLPAIDFFDVSPANGTVEDFRAMAAAANTRGITITMYIALIYVDPQNPLWIKAQQDRRDGVDSAQRRMFRWDDREPQGTVPPEAGGSPPSSAQVPRPSEGDWAYSEVAGRWYATSWGFPALDFASDVTMEYGKDVLRFWIDLGVQGFEYDAPQSYWGLQGANEAGQRELQITTPGEHRPDLQFWFQAEGSGDYTNQAYSDRVGYTTVYGSPGSDYDSVATRVVRPGPGASQITVDQLEDYLATWLDPRRANGRGLYWFTMYDYDESRYPAELRALDAAVLAGAGYMYQIDNEHFIDNPGEGPVLSEETLEAYWDVHRALRRSAALSPAASRERLRTQNDPRAYAVLRRSDVDDRTALSLYNFTTTEKCITVNLSGSGVVVGQRTTDLSTAAPGPWIRASEATFRLPPYGYQFLEVQAGPGFPWTVVDDADTGWTVGGGWSRISDPSAWQGSRIGGNATGAFAEYAFTGTSIQGWGRKATNGGTQVRVFIDGVDQGVHSQRRTAPVSGGSQFYGQQLFSISGLGGGTHTLRLQQVNGTTGNAGGTGVDYLRVSTQDYQPPQVVAGGDRCAADATPPQTTVQLAPAPVEGFYDNPTVTLAASDDSSGVATVEYALDGGAWTEYLAPFVVSGDGAHTLAVRSTDVAGNVEAEQTVPFSVRASVHCDQTVTGTRTGPLVVSAGVLCLEPGARQTGPVTVRAGASLYGDGARITGPVTASGAVAVRLCGSTVTGSLTLHGSGKAVLGDPQIDCAPNTVTGPVSITGTSGQTVLAGNRIVGPLACSGNEPPPVNRGVPNSVTGPTSGQCRGI
jgi:hypothetical protein